MFNSFEDAVQKLSLSFPKIDNSWLFLATSENGERIASALAKKFKVSFNRIFIESIYCQMNRDCEIAMISEFENIVYDEVLKDSFNIDVNVLNNAINVLYQYKLLPRMEAYRGNRVKLTISEEIKNVILVDEAIETGLRMETAIATMDQFEIDKLYIATPVIPEQMFSLFESAVENIFFYKKVDIYTDVGDYYSGREEGIDNESGESYFHF
jgi:putative phosphoribosyl transferase